MQSATPRQGERMCGIPTPKRTSYPTSAQFTLVVMLGKASPSLGLHKTD
jgi:hypothetical protein